MQASLKLEILQALPGDVPANEHLLQVPVWRVLSDMRIAVTSGVRATIKPDFLVADLLLDIDQEEPKIQFEASSPAEVKASLRTQFMSDFRFNGMHRALENVVDASVIADVKDLWMDTDLALRNLSPSGYLLIDDMWTDVETSTSPPVEL